MDLIENGHILLTMNAFITIRHVKSAILTDVDIVRTVYRLVIYMQSNKIHKVFQWVSLFSTYVSSTCFGPHRSIIRSVFYKLYSQALVCGNKRSTRHVQPLQLCNGWTCRLVRASPHTKFCEYSL